MSRVTACDKCGKINTFKDDFNTPFHFVTADDDAAFEYDLCDACFEKLKQWFEVKNKEPEETANGRQ